MQELDINGNGELEQGELRQFVKSIGGRALDDREEIDRGVKSAFANLDTDHDNSVRVGPPIHTLTRPPTDPPAPQGSACPFLLKF